MRGEQVGRRKRLPHVARSPFIDKTSPLAALTSPPVELS
jgi:hypothetical protein